MFHHILLLRLNEKADSQFFEQISGMVERVREEVQGIRSFHVGPNNSGRSKGYSHALLAIFDNALSHDQYQGSAAHRELAAFLEPYVEEMIVCDLEA